MLTYEELGVPCSESKVFSASLLGSPSWPNPALSFAAAGSLEEGITRVSLDKNGSLLVNAEFSSASTTWI